MPSLTRDQILSAADYQTKTIDVPEWGGEVIVRSLTGVQRDAFEEKASKAAKTGKTAGVRAALVAMTVCDEAGRTLFDPSDIDALNTKNAAALDRVFDIAASLNGLSAKDVEELSGN